MTDSITSVLYWRGWPGPAGYLDLPTWGMFPADVGITPGSLRDTSGFAYLLRLTVPDTTNLLTPTYVTYYPAASIGRSTAHDDTPANQYIPGSLLNSTINYAISLFDAIEPSANAGGGVGAIVLLDPKGELDYLKDLPFDGAKLDILQGPPLAPFSTYSVVGRLTTAGILYDQRRKEIRLRDQAWLLNQANIHDEQYTGTGGRNGYAELEGTYKPYGVGPVTNAEGVIIDVPRQIRQLSCSSIKEIRALRDGGVPIIATGVNYATYELLAAAADAHSIPEGHYSTCLAEGMYATGSQPVKSLTADFDGDSDIINGTGYVDTISSIVRRIATGRGDLKFTDSDLDFTTLQKLAQDQPAPCGWFWGANTSPTTKADALKLIMDSRLGWWAVRLNGLLAVGIMENPIGVAAMVINYPQDFSSEPKQLDTYQVPRKASYVGYRKNWLVQDASQLNGVSVDAGDAAIYGQTTFYAHQDQSLPAWIWPTAQIVKSDSGMDDVDNALVEAIRQQDVMGVRRERWSIPVPCNAFSNVLGKVIQVNNYPRYGWGSSRKFICIGVNFASGIAVTLILWG